MIKTEQGESELTLDCTWYSCPDSYLHGTWFMYTLAHSLKHTKTIISPIKIQRKHKGNRWIKTICSMVTQDKQNRIVKNGSNWT